MSFTKVEDNRLNIKSKISIKPYFEPHVSNMGLEKYGMSLHEGIYHTEQLACIEKNGIKRYVTGLNEFGPEVTSIKDPEAKQAKIKEIRTVVAFLEERLAANVVSPEDEKFWDKVTIVKPNNSEFWDKIELKAGNDVTYLHPAEDAFDLIKLYAIEAGGFSIVAKSLQEAKEMAVPPKFYLDRDLETVTSKNVTRKLRNKALGALDDLYNKDTPKLLYITKVIDPGSARFTKSTSNDVLYELMDDYINGKSYDKSERAAEKFIELSKERIGDLKLRAIIKDASFFKYIVVKGDGHLYHNKTNSPVGKNAQEVFEYLKNPLNETILGEIQTEVFHHWNND